MLSCNFKLLENVQSRNYISKKLHCPNELVSKHSSLHDVFYTELKRTQVLYFQYQDVQKMVFLFVF